MFASMFRVFGSLIPSGVQHTSVATKVTSQPRIMRMRIRKMRKLKQRKHRNKQWWQYQRKHLVKKRKAEALFRARMQELTREYNQINAMEYIKETMHVAKKGWKVNIAPSGRKKYPHWSTLMSLEELFGVPKSEYIDKRYGLPSKEDQSFQNYLRKKFEGRYVVDDPAKLLKRMEAIKIDSPQPENLQ